MAVEPTLRRLRAIQPQSGGYLEAIPLTSFVTMGLAAAGRVEHPVVQAAIAFLARSVRDDGSWPIDTNLATWVTTLAINGLEGDLPEPARPALRQWLLAQQHRRVHPYTNADPGGWAWTDLSGGVPDADDTPGAMLALFALRPGVAWSERPIAEREAIGDAAAWLVALQNRDGGWPTFCRGWGTLPFDRSAADISAHVLRALGRWLGEAGDERGCAALAARARKAVARGFAFLERTQRADGAWLPLWFGNQFAPDEENPVYGTARVLAAWQQAGRSAHPRARRGVQWLRQAQNEDGGWGGVRGASSSVEETSLAVKALLECDPRDVAAGRGLAWLLDRLERGTAFEPAPIGFYFAKLWYFESLYPQTFLAAALRCADRLMKPTSRNAACPSHPASLAAPTTPPARR
jgi:squalene-hopene/tetraprenyl-beta-curcumene cyclase